MNAPFSPLHFLLREREVRGRVSRFALGDRERLDFAKNIFSKGGREGVSLVFPFDQSFFFTQPNRDSILYARILIFDKFFKYYLEKLFIQDEKEIHANKNKLV